MFVHTPCLSCGADDVSYPSRDLLKILPNAQDIQRRSISGIRFLRAKENEGDLVELKTSIEEAIRMFTVRLYLMSPLEKTDLESSV